MFFNSLLTAYVMTHYTGGGDGCEWRIEGLDRRTSETAVACFEMLSENLWEGLRKTTEFSVVWNFILKSTEPTDSNVEQYFT